MGDVDGLSFANWTDDQFKLFACLAGSDYQKKLPNMGIKTAYHFAKYYKTYDGICCALRKSRFSKDATSNFFVGLKQAWLTFKHQLVFDEIGGRCVHLTTVPEDSVDDIKDMNCSEMIEHDVLLKLVKGLLDPYTLSPFKHDSISILSPPKAYFCKENFTNDAPTNVRSLGVNEVPRNCFVGVKSSSDIIGKIGKKRDFPWGSDQSNYNPVLYNVVKSIRRDQQKLLESPEDSFYQYDNLIESEINEEAIDTSSNEPFGEIASKVLLDESRKKLVSGRVNVIKNFLSRKPQRSINEPVVETSSIPHISAAASILHFDSNVESFDPQISEMSGTSSFADGEISDENSACNDYKDDNADHLRYQDPYLRPQSISSHILTNDNSSKILTSQFLEKCVVHNSSDRPEDSCTFMDLFADNEENNSRCSNRITRMKLAYHEPSYAVKWKSHLRYQSWMNRNECKQAHYVVSITDDMYDTNSIRYNLPNGSERSPQGQISCQLDEK